MARKSKQSIERASAPKDDATGAAEKGGKRSKPPRKRLVFFRIVRWGLGVPLLLIVLALIALHTPPVQNKLRRSIVERLQERVNGSVALGKFSVTLLGDLSVGQLSIRDEQGEEVIGVGNVLLTPDWGALLGGELVLDVGAVNDVHVHVVQSADGTTNLKRLFKPQPPRPTPPKTPPQRRRIVVRDVNVGPISVIYDKADGSRISLDQLRLKGNLDAIASDRTARVSLTTISSNLRYEKAAEGLKLELNDFTTSVELDLVNGAGTLAVGRTRAKARMLRGKDKPRQLDLDLAGVTLVVEPGKLGATLDKLLAGVVLLEALELERRSDDEGNLQGEQKASVIGLKLNAKRLNQLLQRDVLLSDIAFETSVSGPADKLALDVKVNAGAGGTVSVTGMVNMAREGRPGFDVVLNARDLSSSSLLVAGVAPEVLLQALSLSAKSNEDDSIVATLRAQQLQVKQYLIDTVALDGTITNKNLHIEPLIIEAYGYKAIARGDVDLAKRTVDVTLTVDGDVGTTLDRLRAAGIAVKTRLPAGKLTLHEGAITVRIHGDLDGALHAEVKADDFQFAGGSIHANVKARLRRNPAPKEGDKAIALEDAEGLIELRHLSVNQLLALRGKPLKDISARLSGQLRLSGIPTDPQLGYRVVLQTQPHGLDRLVPDQPMLQTVLHGSASGTQANLSVTVDGKRGDALDQLLTGTINLPLFVSDTHKGIDPFRKLVAKIDMPRRAWRELVPYLPARLLIDKATGKPRKIPEDAAVEAHIALGGTAIEPSGTIDVDAFVPVLGSAMQRLKLNGRLSSNPPPLPNGQPALSLNTDIHAWLDAGGQPSAPPPAAITGTATVDLAQSPLLGRGGKRSWAIDLTIHPQQLERLPLSAVAEAGLRGSADGHVTLRGNSDGALTGEVKFNGHKLLRQGKGPFGAKLALTLGEHPTKIALDVDLAGKALLDLDGDVDLSGGELLALARNRPLGAFDLLKLAATDANLVLNFPDNPMAALAPLKPELGSLPGRIGGKIEVHGALGNPKLDGAIGYSQYSTVAGTPGRVAVLLNGNRKDAELRVEIGQATGSGAPVSLRATIPTLKIVDYIKASGCHRDAAKATAPEAQAGATAKCDEVRLPIHAVGRANNVDMRTLVPAFVVAGRSFEAKGRLDWRLDGDVLLDPKPRYADQDGKLVKLLPVSPESKLSGSLELNNGLFSIPGTKRTYHGITLKLSHDLSQVRLSGLHLRESDREKKDRSVDVDGVVSLTNLRPDQLSLNLAAQDWLVFGGDKLGKADAPRGAVTFRAKASGQLARSIKKVDIDVSQLELLIPDRFDRAHQPEEVSLGDVIFLDEGDAKPGKLPVPEAKRPKPQAAPDRPDGADKPSDTNTGIDLHVAIAKPVHILQFPMNLFAAGTVDVKVRGERRAVDGKLTMSAGDLSLGGRKHLLQRGTIIFNKENPGGYMDLLFGRREHNATLRDISEASAGQLVTIRLEGPLNARRTTLSGAGSPGTLFDLLSVHNVGRQRYMTQPDMPASMTVEYPQHLNLLLMSYLSVNVPHLLFLDRVAAWSDVYDQRATSGYGRVQHYETEGYSTDGKLRFRAVMRPRTPGRSSSEVQLDYLFDNTPQTAVGVSVGAGSRLGGGPGVFLEWSSKD